MSTGHQTHLERRIETLREGILDSISRYHIVMQEVASDVGITPSRLSGLLHQGAITPHALRQLEQVKEAVDWYAERERARRAIRRKEV